MLHFQIDLQSGLPVYRQIMDQVKYYVASGAMKVGDRLPSIRELAGALAVNPTTIVKAYTELQHDGVMEMKQGKGAFVSESALRMSAREQKKALRRLARQLAVEASQMGASPDLALDLVREELARVTGVFAA